MAEAFPVSGGIDPKTFPYLIMDLHRSSATGSLKVDGPSYQKALYFRGGRILFGSSNDPRDQLGAILIDAGELNPDQLEEMAAKVGPGNPLAKVLSDSGLVTQQELSVAARVKVERILRDVLSYREGSFDFEDGVLPKGAVDLKLNTHRLVMGAVQQVTDRGFVLGHLGSLQAVLEPQGDATAVAEVQDAASPIYDLLDGRRALKEVIEQTSLEEFEGAKIACALLFLGLVRAKDTVSPPVGDELGADPFYLPPDGSGLDLVDTARMAFAEPRAEPEPEPAVPGDDDSTLIEAEPLVAPAGQDEYAVPTIPMKRPDETAHGTPIVAPPTEAPLEFAESDEPEIEVAAAEVAQPTGFDIAPSQEETYLSPHADPPPAPAHPAAGTSRSSLPLIPPPPRQPAPPQPEIEPEKPNIRPPSKDDLAALDAILNPGGVASPSPRMETSVPTTYHALQRFGPQGVARRPGSNRALVPVIMPVIMLVLLVAGAAAWWFLLREPASPPTPTIVSEPTLAPPAPASPEAAVVPEPGSPTLSPERSTDTNTAEQTSSPSPLPAQLDPMPPPEPVPTPAPPPPADGPSLLASRQYSQAASAFTARARALPADTLAIQILVACSTETIDKAIATVGADRLVLLPVDFRGRSCFRLCWGTYDSQGAADTALGNVPAYFRQGGAHPKVVPLATLLP